MCVGIIHMYSPNILAKAPKPNTHGPGRRSLSTATLAMFVSYTLHPKTLKRVLWFRFGVEGLGFIGFRA